MSQPVTLFDWGILNANIEMESYIKFNHIFSIRYVAGQARYDYSKNRIILTGTFQGKGTQKECTYNLRRLKMSFAPTTSTRPSQEVSAEQVLDGFFTHEGYSLDKQPKFLGKQLVDITIIEAHIINLKTIHTAKCQSTFTSPDISVIVP